LGYLEWKRPPPTMTRAITLAAITTFFFMVDNPKDVS
jgi:hypothetical protein